MNAGFHLSLEAEQAVIGALLHDGTAIDRIADLRPSHFAGADHCRIFQAILDCLEDGGVVDVHTVVDRLRRNGADDGLVSYVVGVAQNMPTAVNVRRYAEIVRERAMERDLLTALTQSTEIVRSTGMPVRDKIDAVQAKLMATTATSGRDPVHVSEAWPAYADALARRGTKDAPGIRTPFIDLDHKIGALRPGELTVIAGRSSMGKTSIALQFAERAAMDGNRVLVISMEMSLEQLLDRLVSGVTGIPVEKLVSGDRARDPNVVAAARATLASWPLVLDESPGLTLFEIRAKARAVKRRHGLDLFVIDYLQLMASGAENRNAAIEEITRGLKALAKELHIPVVALSQLSRKCDDRPDHRPLLSDLRDSGAIEQDADLVLFVYREAIYRQNAPEWQNVGELLIRKNRQGPTGDVKLFWNGPLTRFGTFAGEWPADHGNVRTMRRRAFGDD